MSKITILFVESRGEWHRIWGEILKDESRALFHASSIDEAEELFLEHPEIDIIAMSACISGHEPDTIQLVQKMRQSFKGPMIAMSSILVHRKTLCEAGCNLESEKLVLPDLVLKIIAQMAMQ
ncbi:MAG: hypothetical protein WCW78_00065 [Candidatus Paceibacterota bacterium]|jgi:hypothetical protein